MSVGGIILGIVFVLGGIALAIFTGRAMQSAQDPNITITNEATGQSAPMGKSGLIIFMLIGIALGIVGIVLIVNSAKG
jgi:hypothetical protein